VCWMQRQSSSFMVENDTGVEGDDGNDSDESMWSLPVRTTTALCVCVCVRVPRARLSVLIDSWIWNRIDSWTDLNFVLVLYLYRKR